MRYHRLVAMGTLVLIACMQDTGPDGGRYTLTLISGDSQSVAVRSPSAPLVVRVADAEDVPQAGVVVRWSVGSGPGAVTAADTTAADGLASAVYTAVNVVGKVVVNATVAGAVQPFALIATSGAPARLLIRAGHELGANAGSQLPTPLTLVVTDAFLNPVEGAWVRWSVVAGGGSVSADSTLSDATGTARVSETLGPTAGGQMVRADLRGTAVSVLFHQTAKKPFAVLAGGNNVRDRISSDLWVAGNYAYTGTWGFRNANGTGVGNAVKIWDVSAGVTLVDSLVHPGVVTVSDDEVSADGTLLLVTAESGTAAANGLYVYSLADPAHPVLVGFEPVAPGLHTGTFADIGGQRYIFTARDPGPPSAPSAPALMVFHIQPGAADPVALTTTVPQPANYGIHDQFVRDGLDFVSDWNTGLRIYDVGDGRAGGSPVLPVLISTLVTGTAGLPCNCTHNAWWYHDVAGGKRYVFVGQEGPETVGNIASGDIHVVDISNMAAPREVATYHRAGAGTHNFWMDEPRGILYAAYYNGGVVALDVTGTLTGTLANREIARITPGGAGNTFVWGVMVANGSLWVSDMLSGFWKLAVP